MSRNSFSASATVPSRGNCARAMRFFAAQTRALIREHDEVHSLVLRVSVQRFDRQTENLHAAVFSLDRDAVARHRSARFDRFAEHRAQVEAETLARHREELARRDAGRGFQIFTGAAREVDDVAVARGSTLRRREPLRACVYRPCDALRRAAEHGPARARARPDARRAAQRRSMGKRICGDDVGATAEDPVLLLDRHEQFVELADVLRRAEKKVAARTQRIVKRRDHLVLHVGAEIDQQVAARHEVDARKRRVANHAMRRENAEIAYVLGQYITAALEPEKALPAFLGNAVEQR